MKSILLSAFACDPYKGSEPSFGWNWSTGLVREGYEVHCLTRLYHKEGINKHNRIENLHFHYISLPFGLERLYTLSNASLYLYYLIWQWLAYLKGKKLQKIHHFERAHHVSWGSIQQGSFLYKLKIPFIFGPAGGGQIAPEKFKKYFRQYWAVEEKRQRVSSILERFNPACKHMLRTATAVIVSNRDTYQLAKKAGARNILLTPDAALPVSFFPKSFIIRQPLPGKLKLLWVGRILPRKGLLLVLDVMKMLKAYTDITLTIVGDGEMRKAADDKYHEYGLQNTVTFVGAVPYQQVREYYSSHDIFFFTSLRDSGPLQLMEAMAFGLPVITLDLHGQGQIISDKTGVKVPMGAPKDVINALAKAIIDLTTAPVHYHAMSRAAYSFALNQVWEKKIKEVINKFYK